MSCEHPCTACQSHGFPILFTRYAAAYSAQSQGMAALAAMVPKGNFQSSPHGVKMATAKYNVRLLRAGYLYLLALRKGLTPEWTAYVVHPHGYLGKFEPHLPQNAKPFPACEVEVRGANKSLVWVEDAKNVESFFYMFHPDPIDYAHLTTEIQSHPSKYMQAFDVKGWAGGNASQKDTCAPAQLNAQVIEFAAMTDNALQKAGNEQYYGLMGRTGPERGWGHYTEVRHGAHFSAVVHETRQADGSVVALPETGPALAKAVGAYTADVLGLPYELAQAPRLGQITKILQQKNGAVVACDDPIGIAQELSLHHLTAAIPYIDWLKDTDANGVSNQWKQAASASITTVRSALATKAVEAYDDTTDRLRFAKRHLEGNYVHSNLNESVKVHRPDGTYEEVSQGELNRRRQADLDKRIGAREGDRLVMGAQAATANALAQVAQYCDMNAITIFDTRHKTQLDKRDDLMNKIATDLQAWLKADALTETALGRYNEKATIESGDGARCASQLCGILLQIDSAPKGRQWYGALDLFTPGRKNLVWRMLSLNNVAISTELAAALEQLSTPLPPAGLMVRDAEEKARHEKAYATVIAALGKLTKTLKATDTIDKNWGDVGNAKAPMFDRIRAATGLLQSLYESPHAVLGAAAMARFKELPASRAETMIAKAQLMLMARGMGTQSLAVAKQMQASAPTLTVAMDMSYARNQMESAIQHQIGAVASKDMRLPNVLLTLNAIAIVPAMGKAMVKKDERTVTELLGTMAGLMGSMRQWRVDVYDKALFKPLPDLIKKARTANAGALTEGELLSLKASAARFVVAGAVVGVAWDAVDGMTAGRQEEKLLAAAYAMRAATGVGAISATIVGASLAKLPTLLLRFNMATGIATVVLTVVIGKLKGEAWTNWLLAQPFRAALIHLIDAPTVEIEHRKVQTVIGNKKLPYRSEDEMMNKLSDALSEMD